MATIQEELAKADPRERFQRMFAALRTEYEKRGLPLKGRFELTPHCTLDCRMCYVHRSDGKYPHRVLTGDEWIGIMDQAIDLGMMRATLTGGECMLHPDFKRIYLHLKQRGVYISLLTNATLIDEEMVAFFEEYPPFSVRISVYGSSPEVYERVTGSADAFCKVDHALRMLYATKIFSGINLSVSGYNLDDLENLWDYAKSVTHGRVNVDCDMFEPTVSAGHDFSSYALSFEEQLAVRKKVIEWSGGELCDICEEDFEAVLPPREGYPDTMPCVAGLSAFFVTYYGTMMPCNDFPLAKADLLTHSVADGWKTVNAAAKAYRRSEECRACGHFGKCDFCAARYAKSSGSNDGKCGNVPCNKKMRMLIPTVYRNILK